MDKANKTRPSPAGETTRVEIDTAICLVCGGCIDLCPKTALRMIDDRVEVVQEQCIRCGICVQACPVQAPKLIRISPGP